MAEAELPARGGRSPRPGRGPASWVRSVAAGVGRALPRALEDLFADRCPQFAAAIAYRVLFSLFPLTILLVSIFGLVLQDDAFRQRVVERLIEILPVSDEGRREVERSIEGIATPLSAIGFVSFVALLWGASGMMASLRLGLEAALKVERGRAPVHAKLVDLVAILGAGTLVLLVVGLSTAGAFLGGALDRIATAVGLSADSATWLLRDGTQVTLIWLTALLLYRFVPARRIRPRDALAGATVTALSIWGTTKLLALVFGDFSRYNLIYGSLAGVMTFLLFVYVIALLLLFGAEFAYAWSLPPQAGPPGPPPRERLAALLRGLVVREARPRTLEGDGGRAPRP
ncbi:MAG: YihY/virulence factor BrkB family protein [Thermoleophilia bacterium]|nr:YihY/virulence factor BrkB family protein [Thermoleophilia bacterium]